MPQLLLSVRGRMLCYDMRGGVRMIGALIMKLALRGAMNDLNKRRKDKIVASYADDAVITYPGKMSVSGTRKGKAAIQEFFDRYFDQFPEEQCVARETYIKNILALGMTNTIALRFEKKVTNKAGQVYENSGISVLKIRGGKVVEMQDFYFDVEKLQKMWGE
jgi:ketosteroid isomerase-like protein